MRLQIVAAITTLSSCLVFAKRQNTVVKTGDILLPDHFFLPHDVQFTSHALIKRAVTPHLGPARTFKKAQSKRERPYRVPSLPPITGDAALTAGKWTAASLALHGAALKLGLVQPPQTMETATALFGAHALAAGVVSPLAYRASKSHIQRAASNIKNCVGPYCRKIYQGLLGSTSNEGQELPSTPLQVRPTKLSKKGGRRNAKLSSFAQKSS